MDRELRDADRVQPRGNRHRLFPVRRAPAVAEIGRALKEAVRDHLILRRCGDDELARRLVIRVVDHRQPLARAVRPVFAEGAPLTVLVLQQPKPVGRRAVVLDGESDMGGQTPVQRQTVVGVREPDRMATTHHSGDRHPFPVRRRSEIERDLADIISRHTEIDRRLGRDFRRRVGQLDAEDVVPRVHAGLPGVRVGVGERRTRQPQNARRNRDHWAH